MRASGREAGRARGGIRSPRGPFLRVWGMCARAPSALGGHAVCGAFLCSGRLLLRAGLFCGLGDNEWL